MQRSVPHSADSRPAKPSVKLASDLRDRILGGELAAGVSLPSEWELVEQTGMTRSAVREALLILKRDGLLITKQGRLGGSVVATPTDDDLVTSLDTFLRGRTGDESEATLLEAREAIEPWAAALAAQRRTDDDMAKLTDWTQRMADAPELADYLQANLEWHVAVARASRNGILLAFMNALSRAVLAQTASPEFNTPQVRATAVLAHTRINEAIQRGDAAEAQRRMGRHVHGFGSALLSALDEQQRSPRS